MSATRTLGWNEIEALVGRLAHAVRANEPQGGFERVVGVARGGLVPATLLAAALGIERVESVQVRAYDLRQGRGQAQVLGALPDPAGPSGDRTRTLIVDELVESGATLGLLARLLPGAARAVLVVKGALCTGSSAAPGRVQAAALAGHGNADLFAAAQMDPSAWLIFPWSPAQERCPG